MGYEQQLREKLENMPDYSNLLGCVCLDSVALFTTLDHIWFVEHRRCWSWDANFDLNRQTASRQIKVFVGSHDVEIFVILGFCLLEVYVTFQTGGPIGSPATF